MSVSRTLHSHRQAGSLDGGARRLGREGLGRRPGHRCFRPSSGSPGPFWNPSGGLFGSIFGSLDPVWGPFWFHFRVTRRLRGPRGAAGASQGADPRRGHPPRGPSRADLGPSGPLFGVPLWVPFATFSGPFSGPNFGPFFGRSWALPGPRLGSHLGPFWAQKWPRNLARTRSPKRTPSGRRFGAKFGPRRGPDHLKNVDFLLVFVLFQRNRLSEPAGRNEHRKGPKMDPKSVHFGA